MTANHPKFFGFQFGMNKKGVSLQKASPARPAPIESPRAGTQQGYMVVAVRCRSLAFFLLSHVNNYTPFFVDTF